MDIKELIKYRLFSEMQSQSNSGANVLTIIIIQFVMIFLFSVVDDLMKQMPMHLSNIRKRYMGHMEQRVTDLIQEKNDIKLIDDCIRLDCKHSVNTFTMKRVYIDDEKDKKPNSELELSNMIVDSILDEVSRLHNIPEFSLIDGGKVVITYKDKYIQMTNDIFVKIDDISYDKDKVASLSISLKSNTQTASEISAYVMNIYEKYKICIQNSLGNNIYYFDHKIDSGCPPKYPMGENIKKEDKLNHKRMLVQTAPKIVTFTKKIFTSNKSFENICGKDIRTIEHRVRFFMSNKDWYDKKGIPYQLGLLLSGVPGSGKTSVIRAIANITKRHIVNVNLGNITTATQLKSLFQSETIHVCNDDTRNTIQYHVPIDKRLYVLEEVDAIGDILTKRTLKSNTTLDTVPDEITLGEILMILDGTMETPGRMLVMTSNCPEMLDDALIRPGRIDVQVRLGFIDAELASEIYKIYMNKEMSEYMKTNIPEGVLTCAEFGQILFKNINNVSDNQIINDIHKLKLYKAEQGLYLDRHIDSESYVCQQERFGEEFEQTEFDKYFESGNTSGEDLKTLKEELLLNSMQKQKYKANELTASNDTDNFYF